LLTSPNDVACTQLEYYWNESKKAGVDEQLSVLHKEDPRHWYRLPRTANTVKSTKLRWAGYVAEMGEPRNVDGILVGKPFHKRLLRRWKRWENNIKWFLKIDYGEKMWTKLAQIGIKWKVELFTSV
jgi:hypothetical protein